MDQSWMNNPNLQGIDKAKLEMLSQLASQGQNQTKSQSDLLPFLMMAANTSKEKGMQFKPNEMDMIVEVLKMGKSQEEIAQIDKMIMLMKMMMKNPF
ncbi:MAG: hypothetical protein MR308_02420 [Lachnospiraceae bacterium]|nr:hypothetical protein [Lachnospiraceae bacterium]